MEGDEPAAVHQDLAAALDDSVAAIRAIQDDTRAHGLRDRPRWPAIVLRTPKGWTGPKEVDGQPVEGTFRAHQVPVGNARGDVEHRRMLEAWMRSYRPRSCSTRPVTSVRSWPHWRRRATGA